MATSAFAEQAIQPAPAKRRAKNLGAKFLLYHEKNPSIYAELVLLARQTKQSGRRKMGIKMLWEVIRWQRFLNTSDPEGYKLNNNYPSRYARLIMETERDLKDFFEVRKLRS